MKNWFQYDPNGKTIIFGFVDGTIRIYCLNILETNRSTFTLLQLLKPHTGPITKIALNSGDPTLVSGSEDGTIFIYRIDSHECVPKLSPLGFVSLNTIVRNLKLYPKEIDKQKNCFIIFSDGTKTRQIKVPTNIETTENSLLVKNFKIEEPDFDRDNLWSRQFFIPDNIPLDLDIFSFILTSDAEYLIAYNQTGSILMYKWETDSKPSQIPFHNKACDVKHTHIDDTFDSTLLSLEQQKHVEVENNRKAEIESNRMKIREIFDNLKIEFKALKRRNNDLPNEYRLPEDAFEIDSRITEDFQQKTNAELNSMRNEMNMKINRLKQCHERIQKAYLSNVEHWPTTLTGFR